MPISLPLKSATPRNPARLGSYVGAAPLIRIIQPPKLIAVAGGFFEFFLGTAWSNARFSALAFLSQSVAFVLSPPVESLFCLPLFPYG